MNNEFLTHVEIKQRLNKVGDSFLLPSSEGLEGDKAVNRIKYFARTKLGIEISAKRISAGGLFRILRVK